MTEWNASDYEHISSLQKKLAEDALASLQLKGTERILDVGCGDGKITAEIARRLPRGSILGVDPSHDMISFAQQHFTPDTCSNVRFAVGDARALNFKAEFDLVTSFNALHWVHDQETALRGIRAALKPTGQTLLRFVSKGSRESLEAVIEATCQTPRWAQYFIQHQAPYAHFTPDEYRALAQAAGFKVTSLTVVDYAWDFQTRAGFTAWCHGTFVEWSRKLPEAEVPAFIADCLDRYAPLAGDDHTFKFYQMTAVLG